MCKIPFGRLLSILAGWWMAGGLRADVVTDWNALALDAIRTENNAPTLATRNLAILHGAIYDAVNAVSREYQPFHVDLAAPAGAISEATAAAAAHEVLVGLYPTQRARYESEFEKFLAGVPAGQEREASLAFGKAVARAILEARSSDGTSTTVPYIPSAEPGQWRRTPPFFRPPEGPHWPFVRPFAMIDGAQFRSAGPPSLTSRRYVVDFNQVKELGAVASTTRTPEQSQIARFWSDFSYTVTPPGHWNQIAAVVALARGNSLSENARLFALLNIALADAAIVCWDMKYAYNFWRPTTAIQNADVDGNPETAADPNWQSFLNAPPFPEYTSGHSTFSKAAAVVLANYFGTDEITFTIGNDTLTNVTGSFQNFTAAADECGMSRIYGGIHFLSANLDGKATGTALANYVTRHFLLPLSSLPKLNMVPLPEGGLRLRLFGIWGRKYVIEASEDLARWTAVSTNAASQGGVVLDVPGFQTTTPRFFRAVSALEASP